MPTRSSSRASNRRSSSGGSRSGSSGSSRRSSKRRDDDDDDDDDKPIYQKPLARGIAFQGNLTDKKPHRFGKGNKFVGFKMVANSTDYQGNEGSLFLDVSILNEYVAKNFRKSINPKDRVIVVGDLFATVVEDDEGEERTYYRLSNVIAVGPSLEYDVWEKADANDRDDDDDEDEDDDDEEDESPRSRGRSSRAKSRSARNSRSDDDDEDEDESDDEEEDDDEDGDDEDDAPRSRSRSRSSSRSSGRRSRR